MKKIILVLFLFYTGFSSLGAINGELNDEIRQIMKKYQAIGVSIAVVKNNEIFYSQTFGYNPDYNDTTLLKPIPSDGIFVIQSISKTFISTAIMQLSEKKRLKLDDDVNQYLPFQVRNPNYPDTPITIRMLMSHRSSINDRHYGWTYDQINPKIGKRWRECYNDYAPGTKFSYCNYNYQLLGVIIEGVTGEKFMDYIDKYITCPLRLNASYNLTKIDRAKLVKSLRYDKNKRKYVNDTLIYNYTFYEKQLQDYRLQETTGCFSPSGGMKISVEDLAKYMMMHINNGTYQGKRILKRRSALEMRRAMAADTTYALGFFTNKSILKGEPIVGVRGNAHGVHSAMYFNPEKKFGIVIICNGCRTDERRMKDSIAYAIYKHLIL